MKCPKCAAYINPNWGTCGMCKEPVQTPSAVFFQNVHQDRTGSVTEADFRRKYEEILASLNAKWPPEPVNIRGLSNWPAIIQHEMEVDRLWIEARQTGRYVELLPQFLLAIEAWQAALLDGVTSTEFYN